MSDIKPSIYDPTQVQKDVDKLDRKKTGKIVSGGAKVKKKSEVQKFADVFISEDVANVKSYVLMDVLVPAIKKAISDIVTNGIDMILYGEAGRSRSSRSGASKVSYRSYYEDRNDRGRERHNTSYRSGFDYDNIIFDHRGDAEGVLSEMDNIIEQYRFVSVGDLYDLAGVSTDNYAVNKYGWNDIRGAKVVRVNDGYVIKLPKARPID